MSSLTFFKRVATVAAIALGLGSFSSIPASALVSGHTLYIGATSSATTSTYSSTIAVGETATAVLAHTFIQSGQYDSVTVSALVTGGNVGNAGNLKLFLSDSSTSIDSSTFPTYYSGNTNLVGAAGEAPGNLVNAQNGSNVTSFDVNESSSASTKAVNSTISLRLIAPSVAGTYTVTVTTEALNASAGTTAAGPSVSFVVTVTAADTVANATSTSTRRNGTSEVSTGTAAGTDSTVVATRSTAGGTPAATIWIKQSNADGTANESMTVTASGPAFVNLDSSTRPTAGSALTVKNLYSDVDNSTNYGYTPIFVWSTGTAGVATITVNFIGGSALTFTETVTFRGPATTLALDTQYGKILRAGGFTSSGFVDLTLKDANGVGVPGATIILTSSDASVVASSTSACTDYSVAYGDAYAGLYSCDAITTGTSTSGSKATLSFKTVNTAVTTATEYLTTQPSVSVSLGGSASTVTLSLANSTGTAQSSFSPGEAMVIKATAVDSSGNPVYDGLAGPTTLVANKNLGTATITMNAYYDGVSTSQTRSAVDPRVFRNSNNLFAPAASGAFTISGRYGTDSAKEMSATGTVTDDASTAAANAASDAAAEAIDAANAATDAANLAAEAADAATVAAEEARDAADAATAAVEELATQVATLMAALKAQITTLANTVAKIAKKVKA